MKLNKIVKRFDIIGNLTTEILLACGKGVTVYDCPKCNAEIEHNEKNVKIVKSIWSGKMDLKFKHKKICVLHVEIDGYSLPFVQLNSLFGYKEDTEFSFWYDEKAVKEYLLNEGMIEFSKENNGEDWYKFKNYKKFSSLRDAAKGLFDIKTEQLGRDYSIASVVLDEVTNEA